MTVIPRNMTLNRSFEKHTRENACVKNSMKTAKRMLLLIFLSYGFGIAQTLSDAKKQQILQDLQFEGFAKLTDGDKWVKVFHALDAVEKFSIVEAIPVIESRIWSCDGMLENRMMAVLYNLHSPNLHSIAKAIIDTADSILAGSPRKNEYYFLDPQERSFKAMNILFKLGDFTDADRFIRFAQENGGVGAARFGTDGIYMAGMLAKALPEYRSFVKSQFLNIIYSDTASKNPINIWVWNILYDSFKQDAFPELTEFFAATEFETGDNVVLAELISSQRYPPFESALKAKLSSGRENWHHNAYVKDLLKNYGTFENYRFVAAYVNNLKDGFDKDDILMILYDFVAGANYYMPSPNETAKSLLDTLISLKQYTFTFGWIGDNSFINELDSDLSSARKLLISGDSIHCARQIRSFQQTIDREYKDSTNATPAIVTAEGWKFLYYSAQHILDRLPQIPTSGRNEE